MDSDIGPADGQHGMARPRTEEIEPLVDQVLPPLVAVVVTAPDGATCDGLECGAPAVVSISVDVWKKPLLRCGSCWPPLDEMLLRRGHTVLDA